ncbi:hypothetical protein FDC51_11420 [Clostridium botulinum]|nr:hypothetical protein [Clostridium botulinum]
MIYGTPVTIDGKQYKLRVLTGGNSNNTNGIGALPEDNEWDTIVCNTAKITNLPIPNTEDLTNINTYGQLDGQHNQLWNWWGVGTICQEIISGNNLIKGSTSANASNWIRGTAEYKTTGWRPVLEYVEIDPPSKPIPVYPTSEDRTHPEPVKGEITLQTKYNGEGSLELMDVFVYNYTQQEFEYKSGEVANTTGVMQLPVTFEAGSNYKITVRHKGTGGYAKGWLELYVIGGVLGKYKISEPITVNQFDPIKTYTGGENLVMKPQTFPETENSKIRLVPQTMNTLTVKEDTTTEEVKYSGATKTPTIGDRLIKDSEIYTISNVVEEQSEINVSTEITTVTDATNTSLSWSNGTGNKSYVYNGRVYFVYIRNSQFNMGSVPLEGGEFKLQLGTTKPNLTSATITGKDNMIYTVFAEFSQLTIYIYNADTKVSSTKVLSMANNIYSVSATVDSQTNHLVVATKESYNTSGVTKYDIKGYWFDVSNVDNITVYSSQTVLGGSDADTLSDPVAEDTQGFSDNNISIFYLKKFSSTVDLYERRYKNAVYQDLGATTFAEGKFDTTPLLCARIFKTKDGELVKLISYNYKNSEGQYKIRTYGEKKGDTPYTSYPVTSSASITTQQLTYDKSQGFTLIYSTSIGNICQIHSPSTNKGWGEITNITSVATRGSAQLFETVNYNPGAYGTYPGLLILEYDEANKIDRLMLRSDYSMVALTPNKVILDKPISTHAWEIIKFLDYDIEVKAGEETATITPTNITNDYYEYETEFEKKQEERKVTVVGRNSKLTTLYYYNY